LALHDRCPLLDASSVLIDDTPEIAELLSFALRDRGYGVVATGFTATVNERLADERADALVLDCSVYEMSESLFDIVLLIPKPFTGGQIARALDQLLAAVEENVPSWSMDDWQYLERQVVADPQGRQRSVALMDVLGQVGDLQKNDSQGCRGLVW
jgi:hypothetical protein